MSKQTKVLHYKTLPRLVARLRDDFKSGGNDFVLLFAYNGTGKTGVGVVY